jgi:hypothetical protein
MLVGPLEITIQHARAGPLGVWVFWRARFSSQFGAHVAVGNRSVAPESGPILFPSPATQRPWLHPSRQPPRLPPSPRRLRHAMKRHILSLSLIPFSSVLCPGEERRRPYPPSSETIFPKSMKPGPLPWPHFPPFPRKRVPKKRADDKLLPLAHVSGITTLVSLASRLDCCWASIRPQQERSWLLIMGKGKGARGRGAVQPSCAIQQEQASPLLLFGRPLHSMVVGSCLEYEAWSIESLAPTFLSAFQKVLPPPLSPLTLAATTRVSAQPQAPVARASAICRLGSSASSF